MVIKDRPTGIRSVLPCPYCHATRLRPPALNALAIHTTGTLRIVDVVFDLTAFSVTRQVELRNDNPPVTEGVEAEGRRDGVLGNSRLEVFPPLAPDIIRHEDARYTGFDGREKSGQESKVHVRVPRESRVGERTLNKW